MRLEDQIATSVGNKGEQLESKLKQAVNFAIAHETPWSRDTKGTWGIHDLDPPPWNRLLGPVHARGPVSGIILIDGKVRISWGQPERADLTFSVAKTYLALLAGIAHDQGLLPDVDEPVCARVAGIGFDDEHNCAVTWAQLLQQTSEWEGSSFGVPDQVDRYRTLLVQRTAQAGTKGDARVLRKPGTYWEYNDVRINQLSLALLYLFGRALPDVFRDFVIRPTGSSTNWQWVGYDNAWIDLNGRQVQSVPGGSHWGGGVSISSLDQARIGQLLLCNGKCGSRQVISHEWMQRMRTPCKIAPYYGYLTWLNNERKIYSAATASSFFAIGAGSSITWVEPERNMVVVIRWIDSASVNEFFDRVSRAVGA